MIALTFLFAIGLPWVLNIAYLGPEGAIYRALAFLIAASPCALIIATPTAYLSAISACARKGVLLKGGITLDALARCRIVAFDKTGTLTTGELQCNGIEPLHPTSISTDEALSIAAALERQVVHPIATAVCKLAAAKHLPFPSIDRFRALPGYGLEAFLPNGIPISIGLPEHIASKLPSDQGKRLIEWSSTQKEDGQVLAALQIGIDVFAFRFSDQVREETAHLIRTMETQHQLTADRKSVV